MRIALLGEHGFYTLAGGAGRRRDFLTAPEVGPLFGAVLARMLDAEWARLGRPQRFTVVDLGAGPGTLARAIAAAAPACSTSLDVVTVEASARQRVDHPDAVTSVASLAQVPGGGELAGVVIANEVLDNVPFRLVVFDGAWREAHVAVAPDGTFVEVLSAPLAPVQAVLPQRPALGSRAPLLDGAAALVADARTVLAAGTVHVLDYCRATTAEHARLPWHEWLRTYRSHGRGGHYLAEPGAMDITVDVAVDQLPVPDALRSQAQFLRRWGIDELVDEGRRAWTAAASSPTLAALAMRSRVREAEALLDPDGLGGFTVLEYRV